MRKIHCRDEYLTMVHCLVGKVAEEFGFYSIEIIEMEKLAFIDDPRYVEVNVPAKLVG